MFDIRVGRNYAELVGKFQVKLEGVLLMWGRVVCGWFRINLLQFERRRDHSCTSFRRYEQHEWPCYDRDCRSV